MLWSVSARCGAVPLVCRLLWPWKRLAAVQPGLSEPLRTVILATPIVVDNKVLDFQEWGTGEGVSLAHQGRGTRLGSNLTEVELIEKRQTGPHCHLRWTITPLRSAGWVTARPTLLRWARLSTTALSGCAATFAGDG